MVIAAAERQRVERDVAGNDIALLVVGMLVPAVTGPGRHPHEEGLTIVRPLVHKSLRSTPSPTSSHKPSAARTVSVPGNNRDRDAIAV